MDKVILAYSGGLDTSVILKWLVERGHEVVAYVADVGQDDDMAAVEAKALATGASKVYIEDLKDELVARYVFAAVKANAIYEGRYLLGTSLARPLIAKRQIEIAHKEKAGAVAHGATGKGNDQVRFELSYLAIDPSIKIISPWKDKDFLAAFQGRPDLLAYAASRGIDVKASREKPYSEDANLIHISHESGILEDPRTAPAEEVFSWTRSPQSAPDSETRLEIQFKDGAPVRVTNLGSGAVTTGPAAILATLNAVGAENGIGRVDMVENRFVGIKSRGIYETPGMTILRAAHMDIEGIAMDREVMRLRDMLSPKFAELVYNGFWFSPEMDFLMAAVNKSQEVVDGVVGLTLYKGNVIVTGRESPSSLYDQALSSMDIEGGFNQQDSRGFIAINAVRLMAHNAIMTRRGRKVTDFMGNGQ
ncbi:MAG TPA: argininosuccinate synthase [Candidatus Aminicenantes bacterium]|nr:argininosuccinate synthase [Candidatus Aminicenantes bacterium]HRY63712.1 argininosuccinate synthase [Candidatus Aminicenantes bacterium]HRZ73256.1 argininosuccinate synthase [Candidatus Aminicenantes bacterium]